MTKEVSNRMTKSEREDLQRLIRQRERVQKSAAKERSAQMLADFENAMGAIYQPEDDPVWEQLMSIAHHEVDKVQQQLVVRCQELGIPNQFTPGCDLRWRHRGYGNALAER